MKYTNGLTGSILCILISLSSFGNVSASMFGMKMPSMGGTAAPPPPPVDPSQPQAQQGSNMMGALGGMLAKGNQALSQVNAVANGVNAATQAYGQTSQPPPVQGSNTNTAYYGVNNTTQAPPPVSGQPVEYTQGQPQAQYGQVQSQPQGQPMGYAPTQQQTQAPPPLYRG